MTRRALLALLGAALLSSACEDAADKPVDPVWGKQPCAHCGMLVTDQRYSAEAVDRAGNRAFFDDVGCLVSWASEHGAPARAWAHDADDARWHDASLARYEAGAKTPMDFGFVARAPGPGGISFEEVKVRVHARLAGEKHDAKP